MDMTLGTWRVSIQRIPPTSAELAALYNAAAHYWPNALRRAQAGAVMVLLLCRCIWTHYLKGMI